MNCVAGHAIQRLYDSSHSLPFRMLASSGRLVLLLTAMFCVACSDEQAAETSSAATPAPHEAESVRTVATLAELEEGERLFLQNCAACHHEDGRVGPPMITDAGYFVDAGVSPAEIGALLFHPLRVKRESSYMPAFTPEQISDEEIMTLGAWLAGHHEPPADPPVLGDAGHGGELYAAQCALCHGANGEGNGVTIPIAAFVNELKKHEMSAGTIIGFNRLYCRTGGGSVMPVFGEDMLSDQDIDDIAAYIWNMPPLGPPPAGDTGEAMPQG